MLANTRRPAMEWCGCDSADTAFHPRRFAIGASTAPLFRRALGMPKKTMLGHRETAP